MNNFKERYDALHSRIEVYAHENLLVAFSGGVDSSLVLRMACDQAQRNGTRVYAVMLHTMLHPMDEIENAKRIADEMGAIFEVIEVDELQQAGIMNNPVDRCYLCKKYLFQQLKERAEELGVGTILEGTNEDDLHVYRPGIKALQELGIVSPLALSGITKQEVRELAQEYKISVSQKPSTPCLATRFPYNTPLSYDMMRKVEQGEAFLKGYGVENVRLRVHEDMLRIEVDDVDIPAIVSHRREIITYMKSLGFLYINIDLEGFRSGSMDYHINNFEQ